MNNYLRDLVRCGANLPDDFENRQIQIMNWTALLIGPFSVSYTLFFIAIQAWTIVPIQLAMNGVYFSPLWLNAFGRYGLARNLFFLTAIAQLPIYTKLVLGTASGFHFWLWGIPPLCFLVYPRHSLKSLYTMVALSAVAFLATEFTPDPPDHIFRLNATLSTLMRFSTQAGVLTVIPMLVFFFYAANFKAERGLLESKLALQRTLTEVEALKLQQDGDYFLTAGLIKPLSRNRAESSVLQVDFYVRQKKCFEFKKWKAELGGDICLARSIRLRGRSYTLFANGDAMGKSMQGAGGAIVLGSVFESIIERTVLSPVLQNQHPEVWLRDAFLELHKVFVTFDCTMLVSIAIGLVDEEAGVLYSMNAEHPCTVLYRDGVATFVHPDRIFRKLGMPDADQPLTVQVLALRPGDILIAGSDGRDDILVPGPGGPAMNEDETLFLRTVERACGDLGTIFALLTAVGELTDDLTLVRAEYRPVDRATGVKHSPPDVRLKTAGRLLRIGDLATSLTLLSELCEREPENTEGRRLLVRALVRSGELQAALPHAVECAERQPADTEQLYITAACLYHLGDYDAAVAWAERVHLREPGHVRNTRLLARLRKDAGGDR